jgi:hypothetical protein
MAFWQGINYRWRFVKVASRGGMTAYRYPKLIICAATLSMMEYERW